MRLPAISLWQPWASALLVPELKVHETRHWTLPPYLKRLIERDGSFEFAIHAAGRPAPTDLDDEVEEGMTLHFSRAWRSVVVRGALLGTSHMVSCRRTESAEPAHENDRRFGDWSPGRFVWRTERPTPFANPIPWKGQQAWFWVEIPA